MGRERNDGNDAALIRAAIRARRAAYAPYSGFRVGAALLTLGGKVYEGCNIENASYTPTCCAERVAIFKAVSAGERDFEAIAIVGGAGEEPAERCAPCGVCRQVMAEFCDPDAFRLILGWDEAHAETYSLREVLPLAFTPKDLGKGPDGEG